MKMSLGMEISGSFEDLYEHAEKELTRVEEELEAALLSKKVVEDECAELRKRVEGDRASIVNWLRLEAKAKRERAVSYESAETQNYYNTYEAALLDAAFVVEQRLDLREHHNEVKDGLG